MSEPVQRRTLSGRAEVPSQARASRLHSSVAGMLSLCGAVSLLLLAAAAPVQAATDGQTRYSIESAKAVSNLLLDIAQAGERLVAAGDRGHILYSDDDGASWTQAKVPTRQLLTAIDFVDDKHGWAVGHDALILATYGDVGAKVSAALDGAIAAAGADPRDRLRACLQANLRPPVLDPDLLATWIAFWSLVKSDPAIAAVHADVYRGTRAQLEALLGDAAPGLSRAQRRIAAISLTALVDGLWLELCLDRSTFSPEEAQAMVESAMLQCLEAKDDPVDQSDRP